MANIVRQHWKAITAESSGEKTKKSSIWGPEVRSCWTMSRNHMVTLCFPLCRESEEHQKIAKWSASVRGAPVNPSGDAHGGTGVKTPDWRRPPDVFQGESNWENIFSLERGVAGRRWLGRGGKHLERSLLFNDMQQMWNEAGGPAPAMWGERGKKSSGDRTKTERRTLKAAAGRSEVSTCWTQEVCGGLRTPTKAKEFFIRFHIYLQLFVSFINKWMQVSVLNAKVASLLSCVNICTHAYAHVCKLICLSIDKSGVINPLPAVNNYFLMHSGF